MPFVGDAEGDVDVPFSVDVVQLGSPDLVGADAGGLAAPDGGFGRGGEALDGRGAADDDAVVGGHGGGEVVVPVGVLGDVRVGALLDEGVGVADRGGGRGGGEGEGRGEKEKKGEEGTEVGPEHLDCEGTGLGTGGHSDRLMSGI